MPGIAVAHGPAQRSIAGAADPDRRMRRAEWPRRGAHIAERHEASLVGRDVLCPEHLDRGQIVVGDGAAALEGHAERGELLASPAGADAEDEPAAREPVDVGGHAGRLEGMPVGKHDHRGAQLHPPGHRGQPAERGEGVVEGRRVSPLDVGRHRHVIRDHQEVVAERLRQLGPASECFRAHTGTEVEQVDADSHPVPPRLSSPCACR